jgi:putative ABC transport system permease protein
VLPGASSAYGRGLLVAVGAWLMLPLLTWWAVRDRALLRENRAGGGRRVVAEAGVVALALAGVLALRARGTTGGSEDDPLLAGVPVLLGLATVVVLARLYPWPVRLLARRAAQGRGAVALIALSRAAKEAPARALALLVLVVTLAGAVFGGLVAGTLTEGRRDAAAWRVGADASFLGAGRDPDTAGRLARARGVRETVAVRQLRVDPVSGTDGGRYGVASLVGVDGAKLRSAAGSSAAARALRDAGLGEDGARSGGVGSRDIRVLADAADAGDLLTITVHGKERRLRVVGTLPEAVRRDPALGPVRATADARDHLLLADNRDLKAFGASEFEESVLLLYGPDVTELRSVVPRTAPGAATGELRIRAEEQAEADEDGLIAALTVAHTACTALAVLLALLALVLELLLSAPARAITAARLRTLGLGSRATAGLHLLQLLPLVLAAVAGGVALGLTLPGLLGPALDLREFTGGPTEPALRTDVLFTAVLAAGTFALVAVAVGAETWLGRRRGLGAVLRLGRNDD